MPDVAVIGSTSSHGGSIISGSTSLTCEGIGAARVGDMHTCPIPYHGVTPIVSTPVTGLTNEGKEVAAVGAVCGCGAVIQTGYAGWNAS